MQGPKGALLKHLRSAGAWMIMPAPRTLFLGRKVMVTGFTKKGSPVTVVDLPVVAVSKEVLSCAILVEPHGAMGCSSKRVFQSLEQQVYLYKHVSMIHVHNIIELI